MTKLEQYTYECMPNDPKLTYIIDGVKMTCLEYKKFFISNIKKRDNKELRDLRLKKLTSLEF